MPVFVSGRTTVDTIIIRCINNDTEDTGMSGSTYPVSSFSAQSPVPAFVLMLQYLLQQKQSSTDKYCNQYKGNILLLQKEKLNLEKENNEYREKLMVLQKKSAALEQALQIETKRLRNTEYEKEELNKLNMERSLSREEVTGHRSDTKPSDSTRKFLEMLLKKKTSDCNKERALLLSVQSGDSAVTVALVDAGTNVNTEDETSWHRTPLHWAAVQNQTDVANILLKGGANLESRETGIYSMYTPLHEAAKHGHFFMCSLLLDAGAVPDSRDGEGSTPMHKAARNGHFDVVQLLVNRGAKINVKDNWGDTPRKRAAKYGHMKVATWLSQPSD